MYHTKEDVQKLVSEISDLKSGIEIGEPYMFGLALDVFDPVSGEVFAVCRPHRRDIGQPEVLLTSAQVVAEVTNARTVRLHNERAGMIPPRPLTDEQVEAARKQQAAQRETGEVRA